MNPKTPASHSGSRSATLPGTAPPQKPTSTISSPSAASCLTRSPSSVVVGGIELSGMSTSVVAPPSAAASVAETKPSHSVRPGSLMCTWVSTMPGSTYAVSGAWNIRPSGSWSNGSIPDTRPRWIVTVAGTKLPSTRTR